MIWFSFLQDCNNRRVAPHWAQWGDWGDCISKCGSRGKMTRLRDCTEPGRCDTGEATETRDCPNHCPPSIRLSDDKCLIFK